MVGATFTVAATTQVLRAKRTITAFGNAQVSTAQSKFGGASYLGDGTGDYLYVSDSPDFEFTGNFTVELWVRLASTGAIRVPIGNRGGGTGLGIWWVEIGTDQAAYSAWQNTAGTSYYPIMSGTLSTNTWYHIAIVRNGSNLTFYKDGVGGTAVTGVTGTFGLNGGVFIGGISGSYNWDGHIDEIRISNSARYTANFTPSTTPFINDANTLLLIHADGTNGSTVFTDDNGIVRNQIGISAIGGAAISTAQSKFGGSSLGFGDGTGDYYLVNAPSTSTFGGSDDMTFEFWYYRAASGSGLHITDFRISDGASWTIVDFEDGRLGMRENGYLVASNFGMPTLTWTHIACVKSGTTVKWYKNGTLTDTTTGHTATFTNRQPSYIGANYADSSAGNNLNGYIDELRISSGQRYTSNFTAPTAPFVNDANTLLLIHGNGVNGSTFIEDDNNQLTVSPAATSVNEGSSLTFNVSTINTADQTLYYTVTNSGDFATSSGSFSLVNNAGSFSLTPTADTTTEGAETFTASIRTESTSGPIIATSSAVTINDTSVSAPTYPLTTAFNSTIGTNIEYTYQDYSDSSTAYVGPDSSNNPVFMFVYRRASNSFLYGILARINTDATVTLGSSYQITSAGAAEQVVDLASEYEDANSYGAGSGDYVYMCYHTSSSGQYQVRVAQVDRNALSITYGTALATGAVADANQPIVAFTGGATCVAGGRYSGVKRFSRSGTTLTAQGTFSGYTFQIDNNIIGFAPNGSTQYRVAGSGTGGGASGYGWQAATLGSSNYLSTYYEQSPQVGGTKTWSIGLDNTSKFLSFTTYDKIFNVHTVTWNSGSAPTISSGTKYKGTDFSWEEFNMATIVEGFSTNTALFVYQTSNAIKYRPITITGTTVSAGSAVTLYGTGTTGVYPNMNNYYRMSAATAVVGSAQYLLTINVQASGQAPILTATRFA
jgi:hypothetical protein